MSKKEYKVEMKDPRGRRSFTLVNASNANEARSRAEHYHRSKTVTGVKETGRTF